MSYSNAANKIPKSLVFSAKTPRLDSSERAISSSDSDNIKLLIAGQGVFLFTLPKITETYVLPAIGEELLLTLNYWNDNKDDGLRIELTYQSIALFRIAGNVLLGEKAKGIVYADTAFYWISLDSHNLCLRFGVGEARLETMSFEYSFKAKSEGKEKEKEKANAQMTLFLETITYIAYSPEVILQPLKLLRDPIVQSVALKVKGTDDLTMEDIGNNTYLPKSNLSPIAQKLYDNVAGQKFVLNTPDFPQFTQAIEYSIAKDGCWCNEELKKKSTEFGEDNPLETYLRITLGKNSGESPGVPYVLEIWPPGHYSPVHNHAGANALIRVLHGAISVKLFPYLKGSQGFAVATFSEGDITWISPDLNQIHQLKNLKGNIETCITIQCYMYDIEDTEHYNYFDYIDDKNAIEHFDPNSDADFIEFKAIIKKEWNAHLKKGEAAFLHNDLGHSQQ